MIVLTIRTDSPVAQFALWRDGVQLGEAEWQAGRSLARDMLAHIQDFLGTHQYTMGQLQGIVVYAGPGSFTGLRIGITVANTIGYAQSIPVVGCAGDEAWSCCKVEEVVARAPHDSQALPEYGAQPHITAPKK